MRGRQCEDKVTPPGFQEHSCKFLPPMFIKVLKATSKFYKVGGLCLLDSKCLDVFKPESVRSVSWALGSKVSGRYLGPWDQMLWQS